MHIRQTSFDAIGTRWKLQVLDELSDESWDTLITSIMTRIATFDATYSRFRDDSFVSKLSKHPGTYPLPADAAPLLHVYKQLYDITDGRMTPLIGQTMVDSGYDATYSFREQPLSAPPAWENVLQFDSNTLTLEQPILLDVGAAGKGYLVDIVSTIVQESGATSYLIDAGGDILQRSSTNEPLRVGLENPYDSSEAIGITNVCNQSLCASASTKRAWKNMHHIIDPKNLRPVTDTVATWVLADTTLIADGLATALFFTSPTVLSAQFSFEYAMLNNKGELVYSKHFPGKIFEATHA